MRQLIFLSLVLAASAAHAADPCTGTRVHLAQSGLLVDDADRAVTAASLDVRFRIFKLAAPENDQAAVWDSGSCSVKVDAGRFATVLGDACGQDLCTNHFAAGDRRFLEIAVGGQVLLPRLFVGTAPIAGLALDAASLGGHPAADYLRRSEDVDAASLGGKSRADLETDLQAAFDARYLRTSGGSGGATIGGDVSIGGTLTAQGFAGSGAQLTGVDAAKVGGLDLAGLDARFGGNFVRLQGTGGSPQVGGISVSGAISAGTLTGDGAGVTGVDAAKLQGKAAADFVLKGEAIPVAKLGTDPGTCDASREGQLFYATQTKQFVGCNGKGAWQPLQFASIYDGSSAPRAARSCEQLHVDFPNLPSGKYFVTPTLGEASSALEVWCDMVTDGGGWMLVAQGVPTNNASLTLCTDSSVGTLSLDDTTVGGPAKLSRAAINTFWGSRRQVLMKTDIEASSQTRSTWQNQCILDFNANFVWPSGNDLAAMADLDTTTIRCVGATSRSMVIASLHPSSNFACGWQYQDSGPTNYVIFTGQTSYTGGNCGAANAGRSWGFTHGNSGCNVVKYLIR